MFSLRVRRRFIWSGVFFTLPVQYGLLARYLRRALSGQYRPAHPTDLGGGRPQLPGAVLRAGKPINGWRFSLAVYDAKELAKQVREHSFVRALRKCREALLSALARRYFIAHPLAAGEKARN